MREFICVWCKQKYGEHEMHKCDQEELHKRIMESDSHTQLYRERVEVLSKEFGNEVAKAFNRGFELGREYERNRS